MFDRDKFYYMETDTFVGPAGHTFLVRFGPYLPKVIPARNQGVLDMRVFHDHLHDY